MTLTSDVIPLLLDVELDRPLDRNETCLDDHREVTVAVKQEARGIEEAAYLPELKGGGSETCSSPTSGFSGFL
jgi:hypothetical protein